MVAFPDGRFVCLKCGHLSVPDNKAFGCDCVKCFELRSHKEKEATADLSGAVRGLRRHRQRIQEELNQIDFQLAALERRSAGHGQPVTVGASCEIGSRLETGHEGSRISLVKEGRTRGEA